ncbi:hypothetical protein A9Q99_14075 [Gammaproteobacteria bacterium 45_16_T64]|nr:hypothetical protein A9Q99_14075 [Gammaproteobacteria bacterium 45_16_T64]
MKSRIPNMLFFCISMTLSLYSNADIEFDNKSTQHVLSDESVPQWYYLSSSLTDKVLLIEENSGETLQILDRSIPGPFASFIGTDGDYFVAAQNSGEVLRFNGKTGEYINDIIYAGSGGLSRPTAPVITPDGKYIIVGDLDLNGYYRYDGQTGEFIDIFAEENTSPIDGSFMPLFSPHPEFSGKIFFASGFTHSIQYYDIETRAYEGDFVAPGVGGLEVPIGMSFGPDGHLYVASSGTSSVKRYHGKTGEYMGDFVPTGSGGLDGPRAIAFGGLNSDLYVVSNDSNSVLIYDRITGEYLRESSVGGISGFEEPRGLTFSVRPSFFISSSLSQKTKKNYGKHWFKDFWLSLLGYSKVDVEFLLAVDLIDDNPKIELVSITANNNRDPRKDIKGAKYGKQDQSFWLRTINRGDSDKIYTITYRATNYRGGTMLATTTLTIPPSNK